ncbi:MAG TPA: AAA family ATPase [Nitrospiria bacterium]|nr:AAA family ATPase [Candidatus Manganitrophaceae bacterium]HIL34258.1 AAA family ATPase [Candidatus Manganitrophaceae bacterium]
MDKAGLDDLVGSSPVMKAVLEEIAQVAPSKATVLLRGESGTGKERIAKLIHQSSPRADKPFIRVSCAALSETLIESELFGHEKGAFTGAVQKRKGRFELADRGTIFLDEIGDLPPSVQVKLLRVLQEMEFERVGGIENVKVDVRTIAATHRDLEMAVMEGTFRQDLYYRLNVVPVQLPPLRERREDIPLLIEHFLDKFNEENNKKVQLKAELIRLLTRYDWPGNVRELENSVERLVVLAREDWVSLKTIPTAIATYFNDIRQVTPATWRTGRLARSVRENPSLSESLEGMEREALKNALERCGWVQARAARYLGITPRQVAYKVRKYKLVSDDIF